MVADCDSGFVPDLDRRLDPDEGVAIVMKCSVRAAEIGEPVAAAPENSKACINVLHIFRHTNATRSRARRPLPPPLPLEPGMGACRNWGLVRPIVGQQGCALHTSIHSSAANGK